MLKTSAMFLATIMAVIAAGCHQDRPHDYGRERPDPDSLDDRDSGLQSKDVIGATDQLVRDLMRNQRLNASKNQWTLVIMNVQNMTTDKRMFNPDIFIERMRAKISEFGEGRVQLVENKNWYHDMQGRELENERDDFGQGNGGGGGFRGIQPDYALYGKLMDMPNRGTNFYQLFVTITNFKTREQVWTRVYDVKVAR